MTEGFLTPSFIVAHLWRSRGWSVIPAQPDSKCLVPGFGLHLDRADAGGAIEFWFRGRASNLAVVTPENGVILDFDLIEVYEKFARNSPDLAESYTESTPRGGRHVFLISDPPIPSGLNLLPGIEVKHISLVYPSTIGRIPYLVHKTGGILRGNVLRALEAFISGGGSLAIPPRPAPVLGLPGGKYGGKNGTHANRGIIADLKARWPIVAYLRYFEPKLHLFGRGRWLAGRCPWHPDNNPSLWVDSERDLWGCQACAAHGDILNWHALRLGTLDMAAAVRDLKRYELEISHV